jgi:hypothetical protein
MNYMLMRDGQQYGPYTLADLQRYVAAGNILVSDLVKSEGMDNWVPLSQVIGNIPVPVVTPAPQWTAPQGSQYPPPPSLHWGIVLALDIFTCGLFGWAWIIVQAAWIKKVEPQSKALVYIIIAIALFFAGGATNASHQVAAFGGLFSLAGLAIWLVGVFSMKASIEQHFNTVEPIGLQLSGVMTFFFNVIYFQYHFTEIAQAKKAQQMGFGQPA